MLKFDDALVTNEHESPKISISENNYYAEPVVHFSDVLCERATTTMMTMRGGIGEIGGKNAEEFTDLVRMHEKFREYVEIMILCRKITARTKKERE